MYMSGCCFWPDDSVKEIMKQSCLDDDGRVTMEYPINYNGSEGVVVVVMRCPSIHRCSVYQRFKMCVLNEHAIMYIITRIIIMPLRHC